MIIFSRKKSVAVQQRFALVYSSKKQLVPLVEAVAFLMLSFLTGLHSKRFHRNPPAEPFYVSFYTTNSNNVLDQTVVKYSNNNILAQAGQAMLAQSNQSNQGVLSLLQ